ncbi:uncharacterized protein [Nicotiana sylvestris]|uniref:uncharacterized protein n=1 Tax=Nicotiana sylvestris TaxID=4096 RepID=UPI00388C406E
MPETGEIETSNGEKFTYIHPRHPLYLHPSDNPGSVLVPHQLTGIENYTAWSNSMKITHFVSKELANGMMYSTNATSVWMDLKERFDEQNFTRVYQLLREICTISQGTSSVSEYYSKLKSVWDEYWSMVPLPCDCAKHKKYAEHMEQQRLVQFLMGLNETYAQARSQVLLTVPILTLNQAYNMIMQDESQWIQSNMISQLTPTLQQMNLNDPTALAATQNNRFKRNNGPYCDYCHKVQEIMGHSAYSVNLGYSANIVSHVEEPEASRSSGNSNMPMFTSEQYNQLLKLISHEPAVAEAKVNIVGIKEFLGTCLLAVPAASSVSVPASTPASACSQSKHSDHSYVHTPQQNGVAEQKHMHLLEMARALRFQAHVPLKFWGECVLTAAFIINRLPSSVLSGKSPYELFYGQPHSLTHLKVFGYLCYATTPCFTNKFSSKAIPAIFMGYLETQKGYKLYNISSGTFFPAEIPAHISSYDDTFPAKNDVPPCSPPTSVAQPEPSSPQPPPSPVMHPNPTASPPSPIEPQPTHISDVTLRKSAMTFNHPLWLTDYVHQVQSTSTPYPISSFLSYSPLSPSYQDCLTSYSSIVEPTTFE